MTHRAFLPIALLSFGVACVKPVATPVWGSYTAAQEAEHEAFRGKGSGSIKGQAFLTQKGGGVVKAAGRTVTLDPATEIGREWWVKAGKFWDLRDQVPPSTAFSGARRTTIADADGNFKFMDLPAGTYHVRTDLTWNVAYWGIQGGLMAKLVEVGQGQAEVILNEVGGPGSELP